MVTYSFYDNVLKYAACSAMLPTPGPGTRLAALAWSSPSTESFPPRPLVSRDPPPSPSLDAKSSLDRTTLAKWREIKAHAPQLRMHRWSGTRDVSNAITARVSDAGVCFVIVTARSSPRQARRALALRPLRSAREYPKKLQTLIF